VSTARFRELLPQITSGKVSALAEAISIVEDEHWSKEFLTSEFELRNYPHVLGITGSPGVGKSTTTALLIDEYLAQGKKIVILAVDPSSPISGGALLGDRIRLSKHYSDPNVYIRSLATRGTLGGLSSAIPGLFPLLGAAGFDLIIVETVGVGQNEIEIMKYADTILIVLSPAIGDDVQAAKAGIMEIGDIYFVNKADLDGADRTVMEVEKSLALTPRRNTWHPIVLKGQMGSKTPQGSHELYQAIERHVEEMGLSPR
jgi:LAO/AO transport system kinase